jgi:hypothetical protein
VEIADPAGRPITAMQVSNDSAGFARLLATIAEVVPGRGWRSASRGPAATGSGWRGRWPLPGCW